MWRIFSPNETAKTRRHIEADSGLNSAAAVRCSRFRSGRSQFYTCSDFISGFSASISDTLILAADGRTNARPPPHPPGSPSYYPPASSGNQIDTLRSQACSLQPAGPPANPAGWWSLWLWNSPKHFQQIPSQMASSSTPPLSFPPSFPSCFFFSFTDAC